MKHKIVILLSLISVIILASCSFCNHKIVIDEAVKATCTEPGLTEGSHCAKCNKVFVNQEVIEPLGHQIVTDEAISGTCISKGLTEGSHCKNCGEVFVSQTETDYGDHKKLKLVEISETKNRINQMGTFECEYCHKYFYASITPEDVNMPILNINGSLDDISKENKKKVQISYDDGMKQFTYYSTIKLQGSSSLGYPKKNYNIQFFKDETYSKKQKVELDSSWGKQNKYTLKANYVDYSQLRNVVSAKIYGDIVHSKDIDDEYAKLVNGGAIDGFPVLVYINGECNGLYTLNTPKDNWIFAMDGDETTKEAIVMANDWTKSCSLNELMAKDFSNGWELEYSSTEDINNDWVSESFNNMVNFVTNNDGVAFKRGIKTYVDVDRVIDAMLYTWFIRADDNVSKNILWVTYDGVKWQPSVYDLDGTWGLVWNGVIGYGTEAVDYSNCNLLWKKIYANFKDEVLAEWFRLREGPLSYENISQRFTEFSDKIMPVLYEFESKKWPNVPSQETNNLKQILSWAYQKGLNQDKYFKNLQK